MPLLPQISLLVDEVNGQRTLNKERWDDFVKSCADIRLICGIICYALKHMVKDSHAYTGLRAIIDEIMGKHVDFDDVHGLSSPDCLLLSTTDIIQISTTIFTGTSFGQTLILVVDLRSQQESENNPTAILLYIQVKTVKKQEHIGIF